MKSRIYFIDRARNLGVDLDNHNKTFASLPEAQAALPEGFKTARYGPDTLVIIPEDLDFEVERYGEIGYIYTGFAA